MSVRLRRGNAAVVRPARRITQTASIFAALGDETRLRIVTRLATGGPTSIAQLTQTTSTKEPMTRQAVTKHLHVLANAGVAKSARVGRERLWELERKPLDVARQCLDGIFAQWDSALSRIKAFVED